MTEPKSTPAEVWLTPTGGLPSGVWPREELVRYVRADKAVEEQLAAKLRCCLWQLFDASKVISERGDRASPDEWASFHIAVSAIPESQHGR